ncbi:unnamed protein product [Eruca vesicaria subsp. sativa]|uniref:Uncharacterized protein n=1 Tax=Eruca vesicaria subsp. sativa TaxID=29727 RepID=A0ABC8LGP6_ERUVS|nr:unnamed protein product [Eruca vesicaria subsp. sativa]
MFLTLLVATEAASRFPKNGRVVSSYWSHHFNLGHLQRSTSLLESILAYKLNVSHLDFKAAHTTSSTYNIAPTSTVANPPSLLSWPPHPSTPFSSAASTVPDHSSTVSAAGISSPDYMLGFRNTIFLPPPPPSQITQPTPVNFSAVEENNKSSRNSDVEEKVCKDCGNRAKKECLFERCRTCCKSRGYNCSTHVKSTWLPSSHHRSASRSSSSSSDRNKRLKIDPSVKPKSVLILPTTTSSRQETSFKEGLPGKIEAPAVFKRIRVTAVSNNEQAEICYQATVTISGHVFKGFLHYYGVDHNKSFPCLSK